MEPQTPRDDPDEVKLHASPDDLDPRLRFGLQSGQRNQRLMRTVLLWLVAVIFLFLSGLLIARL